MSLTLNLKDGAFELNQPEFDPKFIAGKENLNPKNTYVYGHYTNDGKLFYVGKGINKRAWKKDRQLIWKYYVENHLKGDYKIRIIDEGLSDEDALNLEDKIISRFGTSLVNWINYGRDQDFKALDHYWKLRNANDELAKTAIALEKTYPEKSIEIFRKVLASVMEYEGIVYEAGLIGDLMKEIKDQEGYRGNLHALDRITFMLCNLGKFDEAYIESQRYFINFKKDFSSSAAQKIIKRVQKKSGKSLGINNE